VAEHCGVVGTLRSEIKYVKSTALGKYDDDGTPGPARISLGNGSGRAALRREQRKQLESNHRENRATERKGETDRRRHEYSLRKRKYGGT
jgi:hypothetical protein